MRLFAALPLGADAEAEVSGVLRRLRATEWPVRWVRDDGLHLTVKFFGEVSPEGCPALAGALGEAARGTPVLTCAPSGMGTFPGGGRARVLWAGFEAEPPLELLAHRVEQGAERLGFPLEGRPFRPHVTLGRVREGQHLPPAAAAGLEAAELRAPLVADRLVLFESRPGAGGNRYHAVATWEFSR